MAEARIDDQNTDEKLELILSNLDHLEARVEALTELIEGLSEKIDNINYAGDGYQTYENLV